MRVDKTSIRRLRAARVCIAATTVAVLGDVVTRRTVAATYVWQPTAGGTYDWGNATNWTPGTGFPNATGDAADLSDTPLTGNVTVAIGAGYSLGALTVGDTQKGVLTPEYGYTLATSNGSGSLTFASGGTGPATITQAVVVAGQGQGSPVDTIAVPISLASPLTINSQPNAGGVPLVLSGPIADAPGTGPHPITINGPATTTLAGVSTATGPVTVNGGTLAVLAGASLNAAAGLTVTGGGTVNFYGPSVPLTGPITMAGGNANAGSIELVGQLNPAATSPGQTTRATISVASPLVVAVPSTIVAVPYTMTLGSTGYAFPTYATFNGPISGISGASLTLSGGSTPGVTTVAGPVDLGTGNLIAGLSYADRTNLTVTSAGATFGDLVNAGGGQVAITGGAATFGTLNNSGGGTVLLPTEARFGRLLNGVGPVVGGGTVSVNDGSFGDVTNAGLLNVTSDGAAASRFNVATLIGGAMNVSGPATFGNVSMAGASVLTVSNAVAGTMTTLGRVNSSSAYGASLSGFVSAGQITLNGSGGVTVTGPASVAGIANAGTGTALLAGTGGSVGAVTNSGKGTAAVAGTPSYSAMNISAGTLQIGNGGATGTLTGPAPTLGAGVTVAFDRSDTVSPTFPLAGAITVVQAGSGTLEVNTPSAYTGGTTVTAGVLHPTVAGALGSGPVAVNAGGTFAADSDALATGFAITYAGGTLRLDNYASSLSFSNVAALRLGAATGPASTLTGAISGTTAVTFAGPGTLVVATANTYTGGTNLAGGTLVFSSPADLGSGGITFNGGTLLFAKGNSADLTAAGRAVTFAASGGTVDTGGNDVTFTAPLTGTGPLVKAGVGTLTLAGKNTFAGGTVVDAGAVTVPASGSLGTGPLTISNTANTGPGTVGSNVVLNLDNAAQSVSTLTGAIAAPAVGTNTVTLNLNGTALAVNQRASGTFAGVLAGTGSLTKVDSGGVLTLTAAPAYTGLTNVSGGGLTFAATPGTALALRSLPGGTSVGYEGWLTLAASESPADRTLLVTSTLAVAIARYGYQFDGGRVDLGNGDLDVRSTALATVNALAAAAFDVGHWDGAGLTSSVAAADGRRLTGVGVIANQTSGGSALYASFDGQPVAASDVLARYTYYGDANLDGVVDAADYTRIDAGFVNGLTGWANGDFNYDGVVDGSDYTLMDNAFNQQAGVVGPSAITASAGPAAVVAAVPEPALVAVIGVAAAAILGRRRRAALP